MRYRKRNRRHQYRLAMRTDDIAKLLGISEAAVSKRIYRGTLDCSFEGLVKEYLNLYGDPRNPNNTNDVPTL